MRRRGHPSRGLGHAGHPAERHLMLATLEDGIRTILRGARGRAARRRLQEDIDWLESDDREQPFSFLNVCDHLGIDSDYLRARVLSARARQAEPMRQAG